MNTKITPFDAETLLMIKSLTGAEPKVIQEKDYFTIVYYANPEDVPTFQAIMQAVEGRYHGKREIWYGFDTGRGEVKFTVKYDNSLLSDEVHCDKFKADIAFGETYCRTLAEVRALKVSRANIEDLLRFTGGGTMTVPKEVDGIANYSFITENGTYFDVPEGWFLIWRNGKYEKMNPESFAREYEMKVHSAQKENNIAATLDNLFGIDLRSRLYKLAEEYEELCEAVNDFIISGRMSEDIEDNIVDELADMNLVLLHIASIFGFTQDDLAKLAMHKVLERQKNPDYKRKHPHDNRPKRCESCKHFDAMTISGGGNCTKLHLDTHQQKMACMNYISKEMPDNSEIWEKLAENAGSIK